MKLSGRRFIAVVAHTHVLQEGPVTGRAADVIAAANTAAEVALRLVRPGRKEKEVTEAIQKVAAAYDCKIVEGVLSHQLKQFEIDGNKVVLSVSSPDTRVNDAEFEENEVYAIDIVTSSGDGKKRAGLGLVECVNHDLLQPYHVLHEKPGDFVAHIEFAVLLMSNGSDRITSHSLQELQPTKTINDDPEIKVWLALGTKTEKKGGGKKKKVARLKQDIRNGVTVTDNRRSHTSKEISVFCCPSSFSFRSSCSPKKPKPSIRTRFMVTEILFWVLKSALWALVFGFLSVVIKGRKNRKRAVGFFHPYTNDGGGGERVLWCAVKAIQEENPNLDCIIYTGDHDASPESLSGRAVDRFGVELLYPPQVVHLYKRKWIEEGTYPRFTMFGQSFGSVCLSWEALSKFTPLFYFDTSGYAFTYPLARMFGCKVICYTHYPTISLDMISRVQERSSMYNNDALISRSDQTVGVFMYIIHHTVVIYVVDVCIFDKFMHFFIFLFSSDVAPHKPFFCGSIWLSRCKVIYYTFFSWIYGIVGSCTHLAMVNSSWTQSHIEKIWRIPERTKRVYPPCDTSGLQAHTLQLEAFSVAIRKLDAESSRPKLQFVGSCRNTADEERLQNLKDKAIELKIDKDVEFYENLVYRDLVRLLGGAIAGIHSMIDEHFGISVVEYMAAGAIPIAHNSAGPKMDIVLQENGQQTGFLARDVEEYADAILKILMMPEIDRLEMAAAARRRAGRFSEQKFYEDFKAAISPILCPASN
ncbi:hypothetical protein HHK36_031541 [Tetracentron sinense]|uniref:GDP-Man:Man(3)GlcNAc(2)-PP-Dol alpha-1,2-mannosyltransferase n=1 Tax=Tetracentron sinense TaxID=13715 RepID=A0A834Y6Y3_TETSI|nr:hypothetical protein HHK36_031541 [Tetracentron sinense]